MSPGSLEGSRRAAEADGRYATGGDALDAPLDLVLSQGRALIASIQGTAEGAERMSRIDQLSGDELRSVAYAAAQT